MRRSTYCYKPMLRDFCRDCAFYLTSVNKCTKCKGLTKPFNLACRKFKAGYKKRK